MASEEPVLMWFRDDLRLRDNPALAAAAQAGPVVALFVLDEGAAGRWRPGGAQRWWLHHSLCALRDGLAAHGVPLIVRRGPAGEALDEAVGAGARAIFWNRSYLPWSVARDGALKEALAARVPVRSFRASLLFEPRDVRTREGKPYQVFTPFWRTCLALGVSADKAEGGGGAEGVVPALRGGHLEVPRGDVAALGLLPERDWADGFSEVWRPGEEGAHEALRAWLRGPAGAYREGRDRPDRDATSRLSPHLRHGEVGPLQVWRAVEGEVAGGRLDRREADKFLSEIGWREFAHHLLHHFPQTAERPLRREFERFPWREDAEVLRAWQRGRTGYPIVDAGMRQLWATGWMHNRVRMVVASFLTKHLLQPWQAGADWFWDTLVDADLASNTLGWQWAGGCGADAAPYFRIFNPELQGKKHDPEGAYVRRWVPELAEVPTRWIHAPWAAEEGELRAAGVVLGETYPWPLVDHAEARRRALDAWEEFREEREGA